MNPRRAPLSGRTVAVVGFNARPIACSVKKAGASVLVSDYWGDSDLAACSNEWTAVLKPTPGLRQRKRQELPVQISLVRNLVDLIGDRGVDYVLVGSGFDDRASSLEILDDRWGITGNSPQLMTRARDTDRLAKLASELGLHYPDRKISASVASMPKFCEDVGYPCVIRLNESGGGTGIRFVSGHDEVDRTLRRLQYADREIVVQQYVSGIDVSCSVLCTGTDARALSTQGQLIGMPSCGRNCDFVYCGNYYPTSLDNSIIKRIESVSEDICIELGLVGSNGIDYVVDSLNNVWLLEVNPRIQGTLEMLESASRNLVSMLHFSACEGKLPSSRINISPVVKAIVFARKTGTVPDLSRYPSAVDLTPEGVTVKRGDPVCTVIEVSDSLQVSYKRASEVAHLVQSNIESQYPM